MDRSRRITPWALVLSAQLLPRAAAPAASAGAPGQEPAIRYDVSARPGLHELAIEASFPAGPSAFRLTDATEEFLDDVRVAADGAWRAARRRGRVFVAPECAQTPCRLRYRFRLEDAARERGTIDEAVDQHGAILTCPSAWLLRPADPSYSGRYRLVVATPPGADFVSGLPAADGSTAYDGEIEALARAPYSAFGALDRMRVEAGGGVVDVAITPGATSVSRGELQRWIANAAENAAAVYGRLPLPRILLILRAGGRGRIGQGSMLGGGGATIQVGLGARASEGDLTRDWVLTHEMIHLGFPDVAREHAWIEEGLATYEEPMVRARRGQLSAAEVWKGLVAGLPKGARGPGDDGLDADDSWGATYWGGALYWLLADVEIHERTAGRRSLQDALRGILAAGGDASVHWDLDRALRAGDDAIGVAVLRPLYARMGPRPLRLDLAALFARLGVKRVGDAIVVDDAAPLAAVRRALTAQPPRAGAGPRSTETAPSASAP